MPFQKGNKIRLGMKHSEETKRKMREAKKRQPIWNKGLTKKDTPILAKMGFQKGNELWNNLHTKKHWYNTKEKHPNWKGGTSFNPYPKEFNGKLKYKIRQRDGFTCQLCGRTEQEELEELNRVLCVNHIDFDKNNCKPENLNTLCLRCNLIVSWDRKKWTNHFQNTIS